MLPFDLQFDRLETLTLPLRRLTGGKLDLALIELPVLLEPKDDFSDRKNDGLVSDTELAFRQVTFAYYQRFKDGQEVSSCPKWVNKTRFGKW